MPKNLLEMTVEIVAAHLARNEMESSKVPDFVKNLHGTLVDLKDGNDEAAPAPKEAPTAKAAPAPKARKAAKAPVAAKEEQEVLPSEDATQPPAEAPAEEVPTQEAPTEEAPAEDVEQTNLIAMPRHNDLSAPEFEGLDPWLADRLAPKTAAKLDPSNDIHPSVFPNHLICLEDGAEVKLLKSYIRKRFNLTPQQYIEKWNLPDDYQMAPPTYLANKREIAKKAGLGSTIRAGGKVNRKKTRTSSAKPATTAKTSDKTTAKSNAKTTGKAANKGATAKSPAKVGTRRKLTMFEGKGATAN